MLSATVDRLYRLASAVHLPRRVLARILSTFLCVLAVVIRPSSRVGGANAFLVLSLKELVFSVQEDLAQQIEITILNITGALLGIAISTLAKYLSALRHVNSMSSRFIPAIFLALVAFFAGWAKSRLPRLHLSARISCFISIWLLTENVGDPLGVLPDMYSFLWITFTSAAICLFSSILVLHWSSTHLVEEVSATLHVVHDCLSLSLDGLFTPLDPKQLEDLTRLQNELVTKSTSLNELYSQASFELRVGRVALKHLKPLVGITEHLRRDLSWGMSQHHSSQTISPDSDCMETHPFQSSALELARVILAALKAVENLVMVTYTHPTFRCQSIELERNAVVSASIDLNLAWYTVQQNLRDMIHQASARRSCLPPEWHRQSLFATSLLQMAYNTSHILHASQKIAAHHEASSVHLFYPHISLQWLGVSPRAFATEEDVTLSPSEPHEYATNLSVQEVKQGMATARESSTPLTEKGPALCFSTLRKAPQFSRPSIHALFHFIPTLFAWFWNRPQTLRVRLSASGVIQKIQHSSHLQHAIKNAIGVATLSIPAFLPVNSAGHNWFTTYHGQWIVISYVWVLETNTGATWRIGYLRLSGTILGAIYSYLTVVICKQNVFGIVVMVTAFDIIVSCIIMKSSFPSLGVVASVTLPPVVLAQYLGNQITPTLDLALIRAATIAIGIVCALAMNALVFPRHSRVLFLNQTSRTLGLLSQLYLLLGRDLFRELYVFTPHDKQKTIKLEFHIRSALQRSKFLLTTMSEELSLVPKPMRHYREVIRILQKILDLMTGLRKVRENIPRKETVIPVIKERREFISCVCLALFASEHVFRARHPLPQFFPSARRSLEVLTAQIERQLWQVIQEDQSLIKLSLVYSLAEREVMKQLVGALEELLELCRELFGTSAWLMQPCPETVEVECHPTSPGTPGDGWYSTLGRV